VIVDSAPSGPPAGRSAGRGTLDPEHTFLARARQAGRRATAGKSRPNSAETRSSCSFAWRCERDSAVHRRDVRQDPAHAGASASNSPAGRARSRASHSIARVGLTNGRTNLAGAGALRRDSPPSRLHGPTGPAEGTRAIHATHAHMPRVRVRVHVTHARMPRVRVRVHVTHARMPRVRMRVHVTHARMPRVRMRVHVTHARMPRVRVRVHVTHARMPREGTRVGLRWGPALIETRVAFTNASPRADPGAPEGAVKPLIHAGVEIASPYSTMNRRNVWTSCFDPSTRGVRSCSPFGRTSAMRSTPLVAWPPACSIR
jgi:hypothetical protein